MRHTDLSPVSMKASSSRSRNRHMQPHCHQPTRQARSLDAPQACTHTRTRRDGRETNEMNRARADSRVKRTRHRPNLTVPTAAEPPARWRFRPPVNDGARCPVFYRFSEWAFVLAPRAASLGDLPPSGVPSPKFFSCQLSADSWHLHAEPETNWRRGRKRSNSLTAGY